MKEPILEPILRALRIGKVLPVIKQYSSCNLLDIGCGWDYRLLKTVRPFIKTGVGIDFKVEKYEDNKIRTIPMIMTDHLPFEAESFDIVTMLAVLEHLSDPLSMTREIGRILKKGGKLVLTVPSKIAKPVLQFLAYRIGIVSETEMRDHKQYYDHNELKKLFSQTHMTIDYHQYFQMGMNNFCVVKKTSTKNDNS
jgi:2-polyprenyl-3-methyl-5-hydroxy-6-metoxy-1,4-benzoquinol methylase